jgi:hypothetical protein
MNFDASSGAFVITSNGTLPLVAGVTQGGGSLWTSSLGSNYHSHGTLRAEVTLNSLATVALIGMRVDAVPSNNSVGFFISRSQNLIGIVELVSGVLSIHSQIAFTVSTSVPYMMEATAVGNALSLKVWPLGGAEPVSPQAVTSGLSLNAGAIAVQVNMPLGGGGAPSSGTLSGSFDNITFTPARPVLLATQSNPGAQLSVTASNMVTGREYFTVISLNPCPGVVGAGPYLGLCFVNVQDAINQLVLPIGTLPFHFLASGPTQPLGSYSLPVGLVLDAVILDASTFQTGGYSATQRITIL